jgi:hypothetical protein
MASKVAHCAERAASINEYFIYVYPLAVDVQIKRDFCFVL